MEDFPRVLVVTTFDVPHTGGASTHIEALVGRLRTVDRCAGLIHGQHVCPPRWKRRLLFGRHGCRRPAYAMARDARRVRSLADRIVEQLDADAAIAIIHAHDHRAGVSSAVCTAWVTASEHYNETKRRDLLF